MDDIIFGGVAGNIFLWASGVDIGKRKKELIAKQDKKYSATTPGSIDFSPVFDMEGNYLIIKKPGNKFIKRNIDTKKMRILILIDSASNLFLGTNGKTCYLTPIT